MEPDMSHRVLLCAKTLSSVLRYDRLPGSSGLISKLKSRRNRSFEVLTLAEFCLQQDWSCHSKTAR